MSSKPRCSTPSGAVSRSACGLNEVVANMKVMMRAISHRTTRSYREGHGHGRETGHRSKVVPVWGCLSRPTSENNGPQRDGPGKPSPSLDRLRSETGSEIPSYRRLPCNSIELIPEKEIIVRTTSRTALTIATILALLLPAAADASPASSLERPQSVSQTDTVTTPEERSVEAIEGVGLKLSMMSGDRVTVSDGSAHWFNSSGETVATIELSADGQDSDFSFDPIRHVIAPTRPDPTQASAGSRMQQMAARKCIPKWIGWAWNITWGGLVCLPLSVGVSGVATPIAGAVTASACEAAGGALTTAYSC